MRRNTTETTHRFKRERARRHEEEVWGSLLPRLSFPLTLFLFAVFSLLCFVPSVVMAARGRAEMMASDRGGFLVQAALEGVGSDNSSSSSIDTNVTNSTATATTITATDATPTSTTTATTTATTTSGSSSQPTSAESATASPTASAVTTSSFTTVTSSSSSASTTTADTSASTMHTTGGSSSPSSSTTATTSSLTTTSSTAQPPSPSPTTSSSAAAPEALTKASSLNPAVVGISVVVLVILFALSFYFIVMWPRTAMRKYRRSFESEDGKDTKEVKIYQLKSKAGPSSSDGGGGDYGAYLPPPTVPAASSPLSSAAGGGAEFTHVADTLYGGAPLRRKAGDGVLSKIPTFKDIEAAAAGGADYREL